MKFFYALLALTLVSAPVFSSPAFKQSSATRPVFPEPSTVDRSLLLALQITPGQWKSNNNHLLADSLPLRPLLILQSRQNPDWYSLFYLLPRKGPFQGKMQITSDSIVSYLFNCSRKPNLRARSVSNYTCTDLSWFDRLQSFDVEKARVLVGYSSAGRLKKISGKDAAPQDSTDSLGLPRNLHYREASLPQFDTSALPDLPAFNEARFLNTAGLILMRDSLYDQAHLAFKAAQEIDPQNEEYLVNQTASLHAADNIPGALMLLREHKDLVDSSSQLSGLMGALFEAQQNWDAAELWAEKALTLDPENSEWLINLSDALWRKGDYISSKRILFRKTPEKRDFRFLVYMAGTHLGLEEYLDALKILDLAKQKGEWSDLYAEYRLIALNGLMKFEEALTEASLYKPDTASSRWFHQKAYAEFNLYMYKPALASVQRALEKDPQNNLALSLQSQILALQGSKLKYSPQKALTPVANMPSPTLNTLLQKLPLALQTQPVELWRGTYLKLSPQKKWLKTTRLILYMPQTQSRATLPEWLIPYNPSLAELSVSPFKVYRLDSSKQNYGLSSTATTLPATDIYITLNHTTEIHPENLLAHVPLPVPGQTSVLILEWTQRGVRPSSAPPYFEERSQSRLPILEHHFYLEGDSKAMNLARYGDISVDSTSSPHLLHFTFPPSLDAREDNFTPSPELFRGVLAGSAKQSWTETGSEYLNQLKNTGLVQETISVAALEQFHTLSRLPGYRQNPVRTIYTWVRDSIRNAEEKFSPHALIPTRPEKVLIDRISDCKGQSFLLVQMLRAAGFKASLALVSSEHQGFNQTPSVYQFNHMIVHVKKDSTDLFLDPTLKTHSFRPSPYPFENRLSFILDETHFRAQTIALPEDPEPNSLLLSRKGSVNGHHVLYTLEVRITGKPALDFRFHLKQWQKKNKLDNLLSWLSKDSPHLRNPNMRILNLDSIDSPLLIQMNASLDQDSWSDWLQLGFPTELEKALYAYPSAENRSLPVYIGQNQKVISLWQWSADLEKKKKEAAYTQAQNKTAPYLSYFQTYFKNLENELPKLEKPALSSEIKDYFFKLSWPKQEAVMRVWEMEPFFAPAEEWQDIALDWNNFWSELAKKKSPPTPKN